MKVRPSAGATRSSRKNDGVTCVTRMRVGVPFWSMLWLRPLYSACSSKTVDVAQPVVVVGHARRAADAPRPRRVGVPHQHDPLRLGHRQRPQQHVVDDGEERGVGADAERQRQRGRERERLVLPEQPEADAEIVNIQDVDVWRRRQVQRSVERCRSAAVRPRSVPDSVRRPALRTVRTCYSDPSAIRRIDPRRAPGGDQIGQRGRAEQRRRGRNHDNGSAAPTPYSTPAISARQRRRARNRRPRPATATSRPCCMTSPTTDARAGRRAPSGCRSRACAARPNTR